MGGFGSQGDPYLGVQYLQVCIGWFGSCVSHPLMIYLYTHGLVQVLTSLHKLKIEVLYLNTKVLMGSKTRIVGHMGIVLQFPQLSNIYCYFIILLQSQQLTSAWPCDTVRELYTHVCCDNHLAIFQNYRDNLRSISTEIF